MGFYDLTVIARENFADKEVSLRDYEGKVLLIVNTATACGLTPQYESFDEAERAEVCKKYNFSK